MPTLGYPFDPVNDGYAASDPTTGFVPSQEYFAGNIHWVPTDGVSPEVHLYCIDIRTDTLPGFGYGLGTWDASTGPCFGCLEREGARRAAASGGLPCSAGAGGCAGC
ncbi:MAG: hypothetical protein ACTHMY_26350 [Solirubrobacteraceae bacterium]